jgi:hypothetical protein
MVVAISYPPTIAGPQNLLCPGVSMSQLISILYVLVSQLAMTSNVVVGDVVVGINVMGANVGIAVVGRVVVVL